MNLNNLKSFGSVLSEDMEKRSRLFRAPTIIKRALGKKRRKDIRGSMSSLKSTIGVTGLLGVGGVGYGAIKQPSSLRQSSNSRFRY